MERHRPDAEPVTNPERRYPLGSWGLGVVLGALFLVSWLGQLLFELLVVRNEAKSAEEPFRWSDFWPQFWQSTLENWQSEFLQLMTFVVLTTYLIFRGSHESKDTDDRIEALLIDIDARLARLEHAGDRE